MRVMLVHEPTIASMADDAKTVKTSHGELTVEEIAELLPGTGEIMQSVGNTWWKCAYAGRGGNWELAAYFARRTRGLLRKLALVRPKYAGDIAEFEAALVAPLVSACERADRAEFDRIYAASVDRANELHGKWGKSYLRWMLPPHPPEDLDLTP
jgi:hypothetical protein